jgi:hypothetical protein
MLTLPFTYQYCLMKIGYSDPGMEKALYENTIFRQFFSLELSC